MPGIALILNINAGQGNRIQEAKDLLHEFADLNIQIFPLERDVKKLVTEIWEQGYTTLIAGGGDGTISSVANAILALNIEAKLAVLPIGTFNHFAKDIGIPLDLRQAYEIIRNGKSNLLDVGKVNDVYFINNSSLGIYPYIVREREQHQKKGLSKWIAFPIALFSMFQVNHKVSVEFDIGDKKIVKETPFVFIGNNKYGLSGLSIGSRERLDQGILFICIARSEGVWGLVMLGIHALRGKLVEQKDFNVIGLERCTITTRRKKMLVSYDGEIGNMKKPLNYQIVPKALRVLIP